MTEKPEGGSFPPFFRQLRLGRGLTQAEFGRLLGVTNVWVSMIERGVQRPGEDVVRRLAAEFDWDDAAVGRAFGLIWSGPRRDEKGPRPARTRTGGGTG